MPDQTSRRHPVTVAATLLFLTAGCQPGGLPGEGPPDAAAGAGALNEAVEARALIEQLKAQFRYTVPVRRLNGRVTGPPTWRSEPRPALGDSAVARIERDGESLHPRLSERAQSSVRHRATVSLPAHANGTVHVADVDSGLSIDVTLIGATRTGAAFAEGYLVYRGSHANGADLVHRVHAEGTEDYFYFEKPVFPPELRFRVRPGGAVAGARTPTNAVEWFDAQGTPRLRVAPPYLYEADGRVRAATLHMENCTTAAGGASTPGALPAAPAGASACNVVVRWDAATTTYPMLLDPQWTNTGSMALPRSYHSSSVVTNFHGNMGILPVAVIVAGGANGTGALASWEYYDPATATWTAVLDPLKGLQVPRYGHTATVLSTGELVVAGGARNGGTPSNAVDYLVPTANNPVWLAGTPLTSPRIDHTATLVRDGMNNERILIAGGGDIVCNPWCTVVPAPKADLLYKNMGGISVLQSAANMQVPRSVHAASKLANGRILVSGGVPQVGGPLAAAEIYNPTMDTWTATGSMANTRYLHTSTTVAGGLVLAAGGNSGHTSELYYASLGFWFNGPNQVNARIQQTATLLSNGGVLLAAGFDSGTNQYLDTAELFDSTVWSWTATDSLLPQAMASAPRIHHAAVLLPPNTPNVPDQVILTGGSNCDSMGCTVMHKAQLYALKANGLSCSVGAQCRTGFCVNGVCCNSACNDTCAGACNLPGRLGTCSPTGLPRSPSGTGGGGCGNFVCNGMQLTCPNICGGCAGCAPYSKCQNNTCVAANDPAVGNFSLDMMNVQLFNTLSTPNSLAAGFFTDGRADLVAPDFAQARILDIHRAGNGYIQTVSPINAMNPSFKWIAAADGAGNSFDFDRDHMPDVVVTGLSAGNSTIYVIRGIGNGQFDATPIATKTMLNTSVNGVTIGEFNWDGFPNVAVTAVDGMGTNVVHILRHNANPVVPGFDPQVTSVTLGQLGGPVQRIVAGDLNSDGLADLVVTGGGANLTILYVSMQGNQTVTRLQAINTSDASFTDTSTDWPVLGDFDGVNGPDIAAATLSTSTMGNISKAAVVVLLNNGAGPMVNNFASPVSGRYLANVAGPALLGAGDFNRDTARDLVQVTTNGTFHVYTSMNNGTGQFNNPVPLAAGVVSPRGGVIVVDMNANDCKSLPDISVIGLTGLDLPVQTYLNSSM